MIVFATIDQDGYLASYTVPSPDYIAKLVECGMTYQEALDAIQQTDAPGSVRIDDAELITIPKRD